MKVSTIAQPERLLGHEISDLLDSAKPFNEIVLVSAFVGLRTVLRLREQILRHVQDGAALRVTVGIDLGGTSREVLQELLRWGCATYIFHNPNPRSTFHPKVYLFKREEAATLFVGSNNLTDGGFYTNYEVATRYDFELPDDTGFYEEVLRPLQPFLDPQGPTVQLLDAALIHTLTQRGQLPTEAESRRSKKRSFQRAAAEQGVPENPFEPAAIPLPPLLPEALRPEDTGGARVEPGHEEEPEPSPIAYPLEGTLVWRKTLPRSDALQVGEGTAHVGGVRLTQARFESAPGHRIDQTTYFRQLFADYAWDREVGRNRGQDQEHAFVPMRLVIRGMNYGIHNFEVSHKPSGEAGQDNYTTILRWGRTFTPIVQAADLTGAVLSLYELEEGDADFLIDIADA